MESKLSMNMKSKSRKNGKTKATSKRACRCMGKWIFVLKRKQQITEKNANSIKYLDMIRKVKDVMKKKRANNLENAVQVALEEIKKDEQAVPKVRRIIPIPKKGSEISSLVPLFAGLSAVGVVPKDGEGIMKAVMITSKARKDLMEGLQVTNHIELFDNLILKLHKSGLALETKT